MLYQIEQNGGKFVVLAPEQELTNLSFVVVKSQFSLILSPKTAISEKGIYSKISGNRLKLLKSLPDDCLDSSLVW
jgi:hypothetical protein